MSPVAQLNSALNWPGLPGFGMYQGFHIPPPLSSKKTSEPSQVEMSEMDSPKPELEKDDTKKGEKTPENRKRKKDEEKEESERELNDASQEIQEVQTIDLWNSDNEGDTRRPRLATKSKGEHHQESDSQIVKELEKYRWIGADGTKVSISIALTLFIFSLLCSMLWSSSHLATMVYVKLRVPLTNLGRLPHQIPVQGESGLLSRRSITSSSRIWV